MGKFINLVLCEDAAGQPHVVTTDFGDVAPGDLIEHEDAILEAVKVDFVNQESVIYEILDSLVDINPADKVYKCAWKRLADKG